MSLPPFSQASQVEQPPDLCTQNLVADCSRVTIRQSACAGPASTQGMANMQVYGVQPEDWNRATLSVVVVGASGASSSSSRADPLEMQS